MRIPINRRTAKEMHQAITDNERKGWKVVYPMTKTNVGYSATMEKESLNKDERVSTR